ncbi:hypothetical protein Tcan_12354 [Toxocara canis]|uniref:Uncharacterized protein n=1 Tax=Toxocara canis TaxID=6265 RepID=A0A0B2W489_TOXCA|nr:hypothetical protein Tcan_12354 [Toxocara canis]
MLLVASCCKNKKQKEPASVTAKQGATQPEDGKKPGSAPPPPGAPAPGAAPAPAGGGTPTPAENADPVDEGGDNYEDVNIGGGEPPPP